MYYVNDGVYGSFNCVLFDHYSPVPEPLEVSLHSIFFLFGFVNNQLYMFLKPPLYVVVVTF